MSGDLADNVRFYTNVLCFMNKNGTSVLSGAEAGHCFAMSFFFSLGGTLSLVNNCMLIEKNKNIPNVKKVTILRMKIRIHLV